MVVAVMVSMVAFLDSTVITLALPAIKHDLGGGLAVQQWIIDGYLLAMAAAILPGGSLSDLFGRVPLMRFGLLAFGPGSSAVIVQAIHVTRKQPTQHSLIHPRLGSRRRILTRVNWWSG